MASVMRGQTRNKLGAAGIAAPSGTVGALWILVALEVAGIFGLRHYYRKHHGG